jgi:hypothetical protein
MAKDMQINVRLDELDLARLTEVATHLSATRAVTIRMLIKQAHNRLKERRPIIE